MKNRSAPVDHVNLLAETVQSSPAALSQSILNRLLYSLGKDQHSATPQDWLRAVSTAVRDRLTERWLKTQQSQRQSGAKRVYYLSLEFLVGRTLSNSIRALGIRSELAQALKSLGQNLDKIEELEDDAALGNGGLGRLAACFLDSMASLDLPGVGYGIRYEYGMFRQGFKDGWQVEHPDHWLETGNPWEFPRPDALYTVHFGGHVRKRRGRSTWVDTENVLAMAYDSLVPGFDTDSVNTLRLWSAKSTHDIDLTEFNRGNYSRAVAAKNHSENVSRVLYPDDSTEEGRELRLRQEYFFVSASIQDIVHEFLQQHRDWSQLPDRASIHLNDTHPALAIPELMRVLVDVHRLDWQRAWSLTREVFSYTNHTLMPEALEKWSLALLGRLLPRLLEIILRINKEFLDSLRAQDRADHVVRDASLVEENDEQMIRMGHLCVLGSRKVNGVSKLHSTLVEQHLFPQFVGVFPDRFTNVTNGITPRRWLREANPKLAKLIDSAIGRGWRTDLEELAQLAPLSEDPRFRERFASIKQANKRRLARAVSKTCKVKINPNNLFDVHIKRIHEYKRQLLNALQVIARYNQIKSQPDRDWVPRTVIFSGKAASAYWFAKLIIKLIQDISTYLANDAEVSRLLQVVFVPNYGVSTAELIIPGADLSQQISTAGTEASGTGNMKLTLNGAMTIGTEDGANIEIRDAVGSENIFIFGHNAEQVERIRHEGYDPRIHYDASPALKQVLDQIAGGMFSADEPDRFKPIVDGLLSHGDHYLVLADFADYLACQNRVDKLYSTPDQWWRKVILNVAGAGYFSSDRAIREYAERIWRISPVMPNSSAAGDTVESA